MVLMLEVTADLEGLRAVLLILIKCISIVDYKKT